MTGTPEDRPTFTDDLPLRQRLGLKLLDYLASRSDTICVREQKGYNCRPMGCVACIASQEGDGT